MKLLDVDARFAKLLNRRWMLSSPDSKIHRISVSPSGEQPKRFGSLFFKNNTNPGLGTKSPFAKPREPFFYVVRDDLLHPLVNGNKARKLDALLPLLEDFSITDVVTCGGCQSAHSAAVAVSCSERAIKSHLLLRGERPKILTGYCLISSLYGEVTYVPRSVYANRETMLATHSNTVAGNSGLVFSTNDLLDGAIEVKTNSRNVAIVNEGASDVVSLLGVFRFVKYLCQDCIFGDKRPVRLVLDAGTGTTAIGLGIATSLLGLPWRVTAVMLVDTKEAYKAKERVLVEQFLRRFGFDLMDCSEVVQWVEREHQRKFGNVMEGEIGICSKIGKETGVLVDPVYTLPAWETSVMLCMEGEEEADVVMIHTGGTFGFFGLAQRFDSFF